MSTPYLGIDFGTTNTALAVAGAAGAPELLRFQSAGAEGSVTWPSLLYFEPVAEVGERATSAGFDAVRRHRESGGEGRLVQSIKSHLASSLFSRTVIHRTRWTLEELIGTFLDHTRRALDFDLGRRAVVGRPVRYVGAECSEDDERAVSRMRSALALAGFDEVAFEYEPLAAAASYATRLDHDELIVVADLGGGTSDISVVRVGPGIEPGDDRAILATGGVGVGGDAFDARMIDALVAPLLGKGGLYRDELGAEAPVPPWLYARLRRWHLLSFLKDRRTMELIRRIEFGALDPEAIFRLRRIVEDDHGLPLHRAIEATKRHLSAHADAAFEFRADDLALVAPATRADFDRWIEDDTAAIDQALGDTLARAGVSPGDVDRVFATGGSSFVPAVQGLLGRRFGTERLVGGQELTSVATGLAARARQLFDGRGPAHGFHGP